MQETRLAVMEHRITQLEQLPPRVEQTEKHMAAVQQEMKETRKSMEGLIAEVHQSARESRETRSLVNQLFWTGAGVLTTCSVIWSVAVVAWRFFE